MGEEEGEEGEEEGTGEGEEGDEGLMSRSYDLKCNMKIKWIHSVLICLLMCAYTISSTSFFSLLLFNPNLRIFTMYVHS